MGIDNITVFLSSSCMGSYVYKKKICNRLCAFVLTQDDTLRNLILD